jgi:hypothetical protein
MIHLQSLIDDTTCFATVRDLRWPDGVRCPTCDSSEVTTQGRDDTQPERQRYLWKPCGHRCDELTDTSFAGHHQPLRGWMVCLYVRGLNLSNALMAAALALHPSDLHQMTCQWRQGMVAKQPTPPFSGQVEGDEVSIIAGHTGQPDNVANKGGEDGVDGSKASGDGARSIPSNHRSSG